LSAANRCIEVRSRFSHHLGYLTETLHTENIAAEE